MLSYVISYFLLEYEISLDSRAGTGYECAASARDSSARVCELYRVSFTVSAMNTIDLSQITAPDNKI